MIPSLADFGTHAESLYPSLWDGCVFAFAPGLGNTSNKAVDWANRSASVFTNFSAARWGYENGISYLEGGANDSSNTRARFNLQSTNHPISLACWIYWTGQATNGMPISVGGTDAYLRIVTGTAIPDFAVNNGNGRATGATSVALNGWTHLCGVRDSGELRLYVNGVLDATRVYPAGTVFATDVIGVYSLQDTTASNYFAGRLDDAFVWSRPLNVDEIKLLASQRNIAFVRAQRKSIRGAFFSSQSAESQIISAPLVVATSSVVAPTIAGSATISAPLVVATSSVVAPTVRGSAASLVVPVIVASAKYLPDADWYDQTQDPIVWQDGEPAWFQGSGLIPISIGRSLAVPTITASGSVFAPSVTIPSILSAPTITASGATIAPSVSGVVSLAVPTIASSGSIIAPSLVVQGSTIAGLVTSSASVLPPSISGVVSLVVPTITATGATIAPSISGVVSLAVPTTTATGSIIAPSLGLQGSTIAGLVTSSASVLPPSVSGVVSLPAPTIAATGSVIAPAVAFSLIVQIPTIKATGLAILPVFAIGEGIDYEFIADHETTTFHANVRTIYTITTMPRKPARPRRVLL